MVTMVRNAGEPLLSRVYWPTAGQRGHCEPAQPAMPEHNQHHPLSIASRHTMHPVPSTLQEARWRFYTVRAPGATGRVGFSCSGCQGKVRSSAGWFLGGPAPGGAARPAAGGRKIAPGATGGRLPARGRAAPHSAHHGGGRAERKGLFHGTDRLGRQPQPRGPHGAFGVGAGAISLVRFITQRAGGGAAAPAGAAPRATAARAFAGGPLTCPCRRGRWRAWTAAGRWAP
jgi:hypothetical protein